jgi:hypothetical protein
LNVDPILVDLAQLRLLQSPGITLAPGRAIMARVIEAAEGGRGELSIAGGRLFVSLPPGVHPGDELRLVVKDVSADRVVLQIQAPPVPVAPAGERVEEREADASGDRREEAGSHTLALRYSAESLGPIDLRFVLHPDGAISVNVAMSSEAAEASARAEAEALRSAIAVAAGAEVAVTIGRRRPPVDVYV